jgi:hypothetical protein
LCHLRVAEIGQRHQQQHVPVARGQPGQRSRQDRSGGLGGEPVGRPVLVDLPHRRGVRPGDGAEVARFLPAVRADQVGGDAVQPGQGTLPGRVIALTPAERGQEHLGGQIVGGLGADPARKVPVDLAEVAAEDYGELFRIAARGIDDRGVILRGTDAVGCHAQKVSRP